MQKIMHFRANNLLVLRCIRSIGERWRRPFESATAW